MGINEAALKEARKLLRANDEIGLTQMEAQGQMFIVQKGTEGLLLEGGIFTMRVRVLTGPTQAKRDTSPQIS